MDAKQLIQKAKGEVRPTDVELVYKAEGYTEDILQAILYTHRKYYTDTKGWAWRFKGPSVEDTAYNIWVFLREAFTYVEDKKIQKIAAPSYMLKKRVGDCKNYSLVAGSILQNLGIPFEYRFTSYNHKDPDTVKHIYVVVKDGSREIPLDGTIEYFDYEVPFVKAFDYPQGVSQSPSMIGGVIRGIQNHSQGLGRTILAVVGTYFAVKLLINE